jgi:predicted metal-dependent hydrolase
MKDEYDPRFLKGIEEFNARLYFECHETLEEIWLEDHGPDREFYQGIIQIAAGYFKWEQEVLIGAIKLWRSGLEKLEKYPAIHLGVNLESFVRGVRDNLKEVETSHRKGEECPELKVPLLSFIV